MNYIRKTALIASLCLLTAVGVFAATSTASHSVQLNVPEIVMMSLNGVATITLNVQAPAAGGLPPVG